MNRACGWAAPRRHRSVWRCQVAQLLGVLSAASALGLAACGSSVDALPTPRTTSSPSPSVSASPTLDATDAAIIAAYDAYWSAVNQAAAATSGTGAWNTPALSATMVNPLLQQWQSELMQEEAQGIMVTGTFTPQHPAVVSATGTTATVSDCVWDTTVEYYKASNGGTSEVVPNQPGGTEPGGDSVQVAFTLVSEKWLASSNPTVEYKTCTQ
ncbi:MAG: hypothetical protein WB802_02585 [Candidatus Dormiibacterota bacterium]